MQNARADLVDMDQVTAYLNLLFGNVNWAETPFISLLGIGEKGTGGEGKFRERKWVDMRWPFAGSRIREHLTRWAQWEAAAFIVPAAFRAESKDVKEDKIEALTAVLVDIDSGDVPEKLEHAAEWLGDPSFVVRSGGKTETGADKIHAYWLLDELGDPATVAAMRETLAVKIGGDPSFKRLTQVIRMPGSVYGKGGVALPVRLEVGNERQHALHDMADAIMDMPAAFGSAVLTVSPRLDPVTGAMDFSAGRGLSMRRVETALTTEVHEGGDTDFNRWGQFSSVAGHHIHLARMGMQTIEDAARNVNGWVLANMVPPWPDERIRTEFLGLLNHDVEKNGPMPEHDPHGLGMPEATVNNTGIEPVESADDLLSWAVYKRSDMDPPKRHDLVEGMITVGQRHLLVAEGGAGKTFLCMDLALKLAACGTGETEPLKWMGQPLTDDAHGGVVVMFTAEDNKDALNRRWKQIDPDMTMRQRAGDRLIVIPMDNIGGAFPLAMRRPGGNDVIASPQWAAMVGHLYALSEMGADIKCVVIDTLNSTLHGEEASAEVIAQYMRMLTPITARLGAALVITHHVRKVRDDRKVADADAMLDAVRGSSAIKDNVRVAIGIWRAPDWERTLKLMGEPPVDKTLYCAEVIKSNEPMFKGTKYLLRRPTGLLEDVTDHVKALEGSIEDRRRAWLLFAVKEYSDQHHFWFHTNINNANGLWLLRKSMLPKDLQEMTRDAMVKLIDRLETSRRLQKVLVDGAGKGHFYDTSDAPPNRQRVEQAGRSALPSIDYSKWRYDYPTKTIVEAPLTVGGGA